MFRPQRFLRKNKMEEWKERILKSEYGTYQDFKPGSICIYDLEGYCRGFVTGTDEIGRIAFNNKRTEAMAAILQDGRIMDTRVTPVREVNHRDIIKFLVENVSQIREDKYHASHIENLRTEQVLPLREDNPQEDLAIIGFCCDPSLDISIN